MKKPSWVQLTAIVTAAMASELREACGPAAQDMWTTPASASGSLPATHYVSAGLVDQGFAELIASAAALQAASEAAGASVSLERCEALLAAVDASEESPFDALARLGLRLVSPEFDGDAVPAEGLQIQGDPTQVFSIEPHH